MPKFYPIYPLTAALLLITALMSCQVTEHNTVSNNPPSNTAKHTSPITQGRQAQYKSLPVSNLPDWSNQSLQKSLEAFKISCQSLVQESPWYLTCTEAQTISSDATAQRQFFEKNFTAWQLIQDGKDTGLITGYYEPILKGSRTQIKSSQVPIYAVPSDLQIIKTDQWDTTQTRQTVIALTKTNGEWTPVDSSSIASQTVISPVYYLDTSAFDLSRKNRPLKARIHGNQLLPYLTRAQIDQGMLDPSAIIAWADDPVELFFLEIQGSGQLQLTNGSLMRLGYADQNGHPYRAIGKWLADQGHIRLADVSAPSIKQWLIDHPKMRQQVLNQNPSYVFFKELNHEGGPIGAQGVPLTDQTSIAVDPRYIAYGTPTYLSTTWPESSESFNQLMVAQDTGGAIRGAVRADIYWGSGNKAGLLSGHTKQSGRMWLLLPNGISPTIRD